MIEIIYGALNEKVYIDNLTGEKSLLELLQEQNLFISALCDGKGNCGRCRVRFLKGAPDPVVKEIEILTERELAQGVRLACAVRVARDCVIVIENSGEEQMEVLAGKTEYVSDVHGGGYGIAIDIGTTTLAAELFDMSDGTCLAVATGVNHQRAYGADVISRINAANEGKLELLRESIIVDIVKLTEELRQRQNEIVNTTEIAHIVIVGNTTMCHLLRGLSCEGMGCAPFVPTDLSWYEADAKTLLGMDGCNTKITILPGISAFVGADVVAGIFAIGLHEMNGTNLLLDIGTNGEMVVKTKGELLVTSTAAGPVFEGGNISCGMPSVPGAIRHVTVDKQREEISWNCEIIGNQSPTGLCGTGIIDFVGVLSQTDWMDENGTLADSWFDDGVLVAGENIVFTQKDIREVQMAKSAIRSGIEILLAQSTSTEFMKVYLAGGFGQEIDVENAISIGMFPELFRERTMGIGNSALQGAKKYLLSGGHARKDIDNIISLAKEINLARNQMFEETYMKYLSF